MVSLEQALIALGKYAAGYRPGQEGWSQEDQEALDAANGTPTETPLMRAVRWADRGDGL
jgi:hypothetical protein